MKSSLSHKVHKKLSCCATLAFFVSLRLQKQAFDASGNKKSQPEG
jgi:hypothetical protein